jgi:3-oxoacyl-[acyl-carrier protein] reductase
MTKNIILVGASSGIGLALAERIQAEGDRVHALSRTKGGLSSEVPFYPCDVLEWDIPLPSLQGEFDGLVYLPGTITLQPFKQLTLETIRKDWELNTLGAIRMIHHFLPQMNTVAGSSLVLMSSIAATLGMPFHASIASAKASIEGLTRSLAAELAPHIRVNAVAPSLTDTPLAAELLSTPARRENLAKRHPLQSLGSPGDIASAISFLLSDESKWMTGQVFHVDGGLSSCRS